MMTNAQPNAYIRRSVASRADPGDVSREYQTDAVRALAGQDAARLVIIDQDWGRSADRDKTDRRLAFLALLDAIEAGTVSALYAYSLDRLARSQQWSARLLDACELAGVTIVTTEGRFAPDDDGARVTFGVLSVMNENALRGMKRKARSTIARRQARNVEAGRAPNAGMGRKAYGPDTTDAVLAAFDEAGTFLGAVKALTTAGVPSMLGGKPNPRGNGSSYGWNVRTVARIIRRERAGMPAKARQGDRGPAHRHVLSGLLTCACGATLSSMPRPGGHQVGYWCRKAHSDPGHSRPYVVSERFLLPAIKAEAAHLRPLDPRTGGPLTEYAETDRTAELDALEAERKNILEMARRGMVDMNEAERMVAEVKARSDALTHAARAVAIPQAIDWTWPTAALNSALSALFDHVQLGPDLRPLPYPEGFAWIVPEWRADDEAIAVAAPAV
jgi:DNA invertase Pin-like site-specific DNA recombinase